MRIIRVSGCDDCPYYETYEQNGKVVKQTCCHLDEEIHKNIQMKLPENCPLEDVQGITKKVGEPNASN
jgi:hypothetical protein